MTDSMQKIVNEMRAVEKKEREADALYSTLILKDLADRIEATMKEPVAIVSAKNYPEHRIMIVGDGVHCWTRVGEKFALFLKQDIDPGTPLFLAPPDQTKRIEELERELADVKRDAYRYRHMRSYFDDNWSGVYFYKKSNGSFTLKQFELLDKAVDEAINAALSQQEGEKND